MNHITSPDNSDSSIERQIQSKGLTSPRVTPADIEAAILSEHYIVAADAMSSSDADFVYHGMWPEDGHNPLAVLTLCVIVLRNGFTVTGESACASPENFDAEIGRRIARANAVNKIWPLKGYALKEQLSKELA